MNELDRYTIKARLYPSFLILLPAFVLCLYYITDLDKYYHYFTAVLSFGLFTFLLSQLGRDRGKAKEPLLNEYFGGKPSVKILRHSDKYLDRITKERYHKLLKLKIDGINMPSISEEQHQAAAADEVYESCAKYLISKTRDTKKFYLLFKENINYGFRRNLWGMKVWAIQIIFISIIIHAFFSTKSFTVYNAFSTKDIVLFLFLLFAMLFWLFIITKSWIKATSFAYAERLYEALNEL